MADIKTVRVGGTSYNLVDASALHSTSTTSINKVTAVGTGTVVTGGGTTTVKPYTSLATASINKVTGNTTVTPYAVSVSGENMTFTAVNASKITHAAQTVVTGGSTTEVKPYTSLNTATYVKSVTTATQTVVTGAST